MPLPKPRSPPKTLGRVLDQSRLPRRTSCLITPPLPQHHKSPTDLRLPNDGNGSQIGLNRPTLVHLLSMRFHPLLRQTFLRSMTRLLRHYHQSGLRDQLQGVTIGAREQMQSTSLRSIQRGSRGSDAEEAIRNRSSTNFKAWRSQTQHLGRVFR